MNRMAGMDLFKAGMEPFAHDTGVLHKVLAEDEFDGRERRRRADGMSGVGRCHGAGAVLVHDVLASHDRRDGQARRYSLAEAHEVGHDA